jgi:hypothetical protein
MSDELRNQIRNNLSLKDTNELLEIWKTNNRVEWSDTAFEVLREVLRERVKEIPPQDEPILEHKEEPIDDGLEEWEAKLLDTENQPELYDTLEVLKLRGDINKVALGAIIVYALLGLLNFSFVRMLFQGIVLSPSEIVQSIPDMLFTILSVGFRMAVTYFPLKALSHILRILMEMEFRSRKGI